MAFQQMEPNTQQSDRQRIIQAATIVGAAFVASRLLGVVRDATINYFYDIDSLEANAYFIASRFPETLFLVIAGGAIGSAFIPVFSGYFVRDDSVGGWRLFSAIVNLITIITTVIAGIVFIFTPLLIETLYPDLVSSNPQLKDMTVELMRLMLITPIIFGVSGVVMASLNARQHFFLPAIAPSVYNLGIILGAIFFAPNIMGLAIGAVAGAIGHLLIQIPGLVLVKARYTPVVTIADRGVRQVLVLMFPRVLGLSFGQLNHLVIQIMAQSMVLGSIPALTFAWRIMIMPQGIIGQALAIAAFPTFATLAAKNALDEMRSIIVDMLRLILFFSLPAALLLILLRQPLVSFLFERGQFEAESTSLVAWALLFYALSLVGFAALEIISRAFYALEDTWTPVIVGALQLAAMWLIAYWLTSTVFPKFDLLQFGGLALGYTISVILETIILLWLLNRKVGGLDSARLFDGLWRMGMASILMALISQLLLVQVPLPNLFLQLIFILMISGFTYLGACLLLQVSEPRQLLIYLRQRLGR
ncbi:MAG: murein biosynthesis integral membrane protein MurJ [Anaerolineae bacterium]|nr:MAG: murein biosynthesis integral membrane protein MurJ [Anaerolineae bacterium]